jgi:hypothetical protein
VRDTTIRRFPRISMQTSVGPRLVAMIRRFLGAAA